VTIRSYDVKVDSGWRGMDRMRGEEGCPMTDGGHDGEEEQGERLCCVPDVLVMSTDPSPGLRMTIWGISVIGHRNDGEGENNMERDDEKIPPAPPLSKWGMTLREC
jgi:hypothetical protein